MHSWLEIGSEFFVNLAVVLFTAALIEPQISGTSKEVFLSLTARSVTGILCLVLAKEFREKAKEQ